MSCYLWRLLAANPSIGSFIVTAPRLVPRAATQLLHAASCGAFLGVSLRYRHHPK
ncbi:MAG: hypothetical protein ACRC9N_02485 [Aeromonas sp.]